mmetsp:Transcript_66489/g.182355  ORF Transcript_66489/g.182355 Transcript_66489/m.182355 type:complete len:114 (-) Transcript_66489:441-782(-)
MDKIEYKRLKYEYQGRTIYEWEQTLEDVHMYVQPPPGVTAKMMDCKIGASHLKLGIKGNPPFIDEDWEQTVNASESTWMMGARPARAWPRAAFAHRRAVRVRVPQRMESSTSC